MTGSQLKAARRQLGYTQAQLAEKLHLHIATISRYEMPSNHGRFPINDTVADLITLWLKEVL